MAPPEKHSDHPGCEIKSPRRMRSNLKQAWFNLARRGSKILSVYKQLPRFLKLGALYLAVGLVVAGIFSWQVWNLRVAHPYIADNKPGIGESPRDNDSLEIASIDRPIKGDPVLPEMETKPEYDLPPASIEVQGNSVSTLDLHWDGIWPISGELLYSYHDPVAQALNLPYIRYRFSKGLAIKAASGTEVWAAWKGIVTRISERGYPYGQAVTLQHDNGLTVYYGALQEVVVEEGSHLRQGEGIGYLAGGCGEDPAYLYLEVRKNREPVDPLLYLP